MPDARPELAVTDVLTPLARQVLEVAADDAYGRLVVHGPGTEEARRLLKGVTPAQLIARPVADEQAALGVLSGLWLWHDWLDESHRISQDLASPTGSFWHAIMHRREGDFSNAKYWYARCKTHPVMRTVAVGAAPIVGDPTVRSTQAGVSGVGGSDFFAREGWDPDGFVDWVEQVHDRPTDPTHAAAVALQRVEWRTLFADCAFAAAGAGTILGGGIES